MEKFKTVKKIIDGVEYTAHFQQRLKPLTTAI